MQLIWLSGPTAKVVTLSITRRKLLISALAAAALVFVLGGVMQFFGLRVAIEIRPEWARALGAVTSASERDRLEQYYQNQLNTLENQIGHLSQQLSALEKTKRKLVDIIPANAVRTGAGGQGGPAGLIDPLDWFAPTATAQLHKLSLASARLENRISALDEAWNQEGEWLQRLPIQVPILAEHHISSGFGLRLDPFTRLLRRHEGVDYVAPTGTPVVATAPGRVTRAGYWGPYGYMVDVEHEWGFTTRYAHLSRIRVEPGEVVHTGQTVGLLGNSGRSTGPHLHYEVHFRDRPINPRAQHVLQIAQQHSVFPQHIEARNQHVR
jgi:murein DD-endopeptidase MepM/ murein hydrolase activator NlpD